MNLPGSQAPGAQVRDGLRRLFILDARNSVEHRYLRDWIHATWGAEEPGPGLDYVSLPLADDNRSLKVTALAAKLATTTVVPARTVNRGT